MSISAMKQALEALEELRFANAPFLDKAMEALRTALAESANSTTDFVEPKTRLQPEQETVAIRHPLIEQIARLIDENQMLRAGLKFGTAPPKREWLGLTREDKAWAEMLNEPYGISEKAYLYLDAKLKEKNT